MFYEKYLTLCSQRGLSPSAAALEIGFSNSAATQWSHGSQPSNASIYKIAQYFQVAPEYFTGEDSSQGQSECKPGDFHFERFLSMCKEQGKKQSHLYEMVGMPSKAGSNLRRTKKIKTEILEVWAQELNTSVAYLNGETDDPSPMQKEKPAAQGNGLEEKFSGLLDKMSQDEQANVLKYMEFVLSNRDSGNQ